MLSEEYSDLDNTGKIILDNIYNAPNPSSYYTTLSRLDYQIPEKAKPVFQNIIQQYRQKFQKDKVRILDVGCSYGVNAMLLKCDLNMAQLNEHYGQARKNNLSTVEMLKQDKRFLKNNIRDNNLEVIGLDKSSNAIDYAIRATILDGGADDNLEKNRPSVEAMKVLDGIDIITSTGCIGYVTEKTLKWLLKINTPGSPWLVNFVLRMFPMDDIDTELQKFGYITEKIENITFPQRKFANSEEQTQVLKRLAELDIDPTGRETEGWFHADAYISRPNT